MSGPETFLDGRVTLWLGDVRASLMAMEPDSVDCVVTSPPYWGLRDYGVAGQIGLEPTLGEHLAVMVEVFEHVRRVLKPTGTCWINYGDCYATSPNGRSAAATKLAGGDDRTFRDKPFSTIGAIYAPDHEKTMRAGKSANKGQVAGALGGRVVAGGFLKPKDLCMVPNRLAIALQDAGWWVRSEIIWGKPNPMPESIRDRPATAHEKVFLLTKSERYYYDAEAVRQGAARSSVNRWAQDIDGQVGSERAHAGGRVNGPMKAVGGPRGRSTHGRHTLGDAIPETERRTKQDATASSAAAVGGSSGRRMGEFNARWDASEKVRASDVASPRHAGHINHTGIEDTPRGSRNLRNYEPAPVTVWPIATRPFPDAHFATFPPELAERCILAGCPVGGVVLDPFGGAGTTAMVALRHRRRAVLIELNPEYARIARLRIERDWMGASARRRDRTKDAPLDLGPLFSPSEAAE